SSFSSESCPKKESQEAEVEQEKNEINEVSSVSPKTKPSQSVRDESSEGERYSAQGTLRSIASDGHSRRSDKTLLMKYEMEEAREEACIEATTEVSHRTNAEEISEEEKSGKKNVEEEENEPNDEVEKETAEASAINEEGEESTAGARDCTLLAQKTFESKLAGQEETAETGTELTEAEEQDKEEEQSSRPSTACSKLKGEEKAQSTREDSLIQEAEDNKEDQCNNCENGQEEEGENENEENNKLAENGEQGAEAVNDDLPKENLQNAADQLATTNDANISDANSDTKLKADLEKQLVEESPNDPEEEDAKTSVSTTQANDHDQANEKYKDEGNSKASLGASKVRRNKNIKRSETLNKAAAFSCYSSIGNFSQQSQKGSDDEEEECKDNNNPTSDLPNGETQSDESSKPSKMYPDSEEEEEDKASSCTDPMGEEDQVDAESEDPKEDDHTDEVQASKKKEDSDEIDQDDLD
ncbi:hypothetical protein N308_08630, partial [Struthio camelus australis]